MNLFYNAVKCAALSKRSLLLPAGRVEAHSRCRLAAHHVMFSHLCSRVCGAANGTPCLLPAFLLLPPLHGGKQVVQLKHCQRLIASAPVQDCAFHPLEPLVATGLITGRVHVLRYNTSSCVEPMEKRLALKAHAESCRSLRFSPDGAMLLTASADMCAGQPVAVAVFCSGHTANPQPAVKASLVAKQQPCVASQVTAQLQSLGALSCYPTQVLAGSGRGHGQGSGQAPGRACCAHQPRAAAVRDRRGLRRRRGRRAPVGHPAGRPLRAGYSRHPT